MGVAEKITALRTDSRLEKVRKQAEELGRQIEHLSGEKFAPKAKYEGYDNSKKFIPIARPRVFKSRVR